LPDCWVLAPLLWVLELTFHNCSFFPRLTLVPIALLSIYLGLFPPPFPDRFSYLFHHLHPVPFTLAVFPCLVWDLTFMILAPWLFPASLCVFVLYCPLYCVTCDSLLFSCSHIFEHAPLEWARYHSCNLLARLFPFFYPLLSQFSPTGSSSGTFPLPVCINLWLL